MAQWLECGTLPMLLPVVQTLLGAGSLDKYHISPLSILGYSCDVLSLGKALHPQMLHLTQVKRSTW